MYHRVYFRQGDKNKIIILNLLAMEDIQIILYIILAVIAILSRVFKANKQAKQSAPPASGQEGSSKPVKSFEDLLREFTEGPTQRPAPAPIYELEEEEEEDDYFAQRDAEAQRIFQESIYTPAVSSMESLERNEGLSDSEREFRRFAEFDKQEEAGIAADIHHILSEVDGAKKAVVLSEILNRKY
jgi:hypothetical protein